MITDAAQIVLPPGWTRIGSIEPSWFTAQTPGGLRVIASVDEIDGKPWLHVSISRKSRMPSYEDLALVKRALIGVDNAAYQCFPKSADHVNNHNFCLHLWAPQGFDPFPDVLGERSANVGLKGVSPEQVKALVASLQK